MPLGRFGSVPPESFAARDDGSPDFVQWWYFDAELDDGHRLMAIFFPRAFASIDDLGNGPEPAVTLTLTTPRGATRQAAAFYPGALTLEPAARRVRFGDNRLEIDSAGNYRVVLRQGGIGCDLTYTPELAPWAPLPGPCGRMATPLLWLAAMRPLAGRSFHYASVMPRAHVAGTLWQDGRELTVGGTGYHEGGRTDVALARLFSYWYWARLFVGEWSFIFPMAATPRHSLHKSMRALLVARGTQIIGDAFDASGLLLSHRVHRYDTHAASGRQFPQALTFEGKLPGVRVTIEVELTDERVSFRFAPFAGPTPLPSTWMQHFARMAVDLRYEGERVLLEGEGVFETMLSGAI